MTKKQGQQVLDFKSVAGLSEFTRGDILESVANLIATNDQVRVSMSSYPQCV